MLRSFFFWLLVVLCSLVGGCIAVLEYDDKIVNAELRARESVEAIAVVRAIGVDAEIQYKKTFHVPTMEDLNCDGKPCRAYTFITNEAWIDGNGVVHAKYRKLGVPFTPTSQFDITWNSLERTTERDYLIHPWQWRIRFPVSLLLCLTIIAIPWSPKLWRRYKSKRVEELRPTYHTE
jgi:hypothetical protein